VPAVKEAFQSPGVYISGIACDSADIVSPVTVRRKVTDSLKQEVFKEAGKADTSVRANLTNWATVYSHLNLPGCSHIAHLPVVDSAKDIFHSNLYLFRPRAGELAALRFEQEPDSEGGTGPFAPWAIPR
jgi:hypothetical protein